MKFKIFVGQHVDRLLFIETRNSVIWRNTDVLTRLIIAMSLLLLFPTIRPPNFKLASSRRRRRRRRLSPMSNRVKLREPN